MKIDYRSFFNIKPDLNKRKKHDNLLIVVAPSLAVVAKPIVALSLADAAKPEAIQVNSIA